MEITAISLQEVETNGNVLFTETPVKPSKCMVHREGSGLVTLKGITSNCYARYLVYFSGNIAIPDGGTVGEIGLAIAINGESIQSSEMIVTPTATESFFNVSSAVYVEVPKCCCNTVSVQNVSTEEVAVENANLIITRVA